ncbi:MAG: L-threonylcarbamoyladenylate synthase [Rhizobiaceae bacterium]
MAEILSISDETLDRAAALLRAGGIVAVPTETVYGLAADATNGRAVAAIYEAKGRPPFNPLIVHVSGMEMAESLAIFDPVSRQLAEAFWPGPLTLVLPLKPHSSISNLVTAGLETVGLRCPKGPARDLIARLGSPLAAPSANSSGRISATSAKAVAADLGAHIPLILDGGASPVGVESTIVKVEDGHVRLLRPGGIAGENIEKACGMPLERIDQRAAIEAPGMLASHYAPHAKVRLDAVRLLPGEALLAFGPRRGCGVENAVKTLNLSPSGDLAEAASNLFAYLAELDQSGALCIAVEPIPERGLGEAIIDRLKRAAAPRGT